MFGGLTAYIASIQQIVFDAFHAPTLIGLVFAAVAAPMALASWANTPRRRAFGLRRVGHVGLIGFVVDHRWSMPLLALSSSTSRCGCSSSLMGLTMVAFAFTTSNFATLAMTNMAAIAGTASSVQGVVGTIGGALIGLVIGQAFDGTAAPVPDRLGLLRRGRAAAGAV